jgi:hypothetical protein
LHYVVIYRTM